MKPAYLKHFLFAIVIIAIWSWGHGKITFESWKIPISNAGDGLDVMAISKAYLQNEINPFTYQFVSRLGAPFGANWTDFSVTDDLSYFTIGVLGRLVGLGFATNLVLILIHLLNAFAYLYLARSFRVNWYLAYASAILFSFSTYAWYRGLAHFNLMLYGQIALYLTALYATFSKQKLPISKMILGWGIAFLTGIFNPYYTLMCVLLTGVVFVLHLTRGDKNRCVYLISLLAASMLGFGLMNLNTLIFNWEFGYNPAATVRSLLGLAIYALKPSDLLLPAQHRWTEIRNFTQINYYVQGRARDEGDTVYIGIFAITGLIFLTFMLFQSIQKNKIKHIPIELSWLIVLMLYAITGGVNSLVGALGFQFFRATNRFSILIMCIGLLYFIRQINRIKNITIKNLCSIMILALGIWDQAPVFVGRLPLQPTNYEDHPYNQDRRMGVIMEQNLSPNAMVFQFPVVSYPEAPPIRSMTDYEHFRPYLHTNTLRFSYGDVKGRANTEWQQRLSSQPFSESIPFLEAAGFEAVMMHKKAYENDAKTEILTITQLGKPIIFQNQTFILWRLNPSPNPQLPFAPNFKVVYGSGFYAEERDDKTNTYWQWAHGNTNIFIQTNLKSHNNTSNSTIEFEIRTIKRGRTVWLTFGSDRILVLNSDEDRRSIKLTDLDLDRIREFVFTTDTPAILPGNGDTRPIAFGVFNFKITEQ
ncbi:MAG: hypothetical protein KIH69_021965 [Anaerolineae bacterium]|nr:hypothetical protein [Anaerolineae bacterium]